MKKDGPYGFLRIFLKLEDVPFSSSSSKAALFNLKDPDVNFQRAI